MDIIKTYLDNRIIRTLVMIVVAYIIYLAINTIVAKAIDRYSKRKHIDNKAKTYIKVLKNIFKYVFLMFVIVVLLQLNGIDVSALVTGLGVAGVVGGFALQDTLKDLIMGINIILEDFFNVGEIVKIGNVEGKVISFGLKSTKIQSIDNNDLITIANRNISEVSRISDWKDMIIPASYDDKIDDVELALGNAIDKIKKIEDVTNCEYKGVTEFGASSIDYRVRLFCKPERKLQVRRDALRIIKKEFDAAGITIPYTQVDIHNID